MKYACWLCVLIFCACSKQYKYDFETTPLKGEIEGKPWEYRQAVARWEQDTVRLRIFADSFSILNICNSMDTLMTLGFGDALEVKLPFADLERLHYLHFNFTEYKGVVVNFFSQEYQINDVAIKGAIDIAEWDLNAGILRGYMDICYNKHTFCNGFFEASLCP